MAIRVMNLISVLILSFFAVTNVLSVIQYRLHSSDYRFPLEMGGFAYRSPAHYVAVASATIAVCVIALLVSYTRLPSEIVLGARLALAVALIAWALTWWIE
jgi:hypothetical protein